MKNGKIEFQLNGTAWNGDDDDRFIELRVKDEASGRLVLTVSFTGAEIVAALAGRVLSKIPCRWLDTEHIGWTSTVHRREVWVPSGDTYNDRRKAKAAVEKACKQIRKEFPGSVVTAREDDASNPHQLVARKDGGAYYRVTFWVLTPPESR